MRSSLIIVLIILTFANCSENRRTEPTEYVHKGELLIFDTLSNKYVISKSDTKLISTWNLFRNTISTNDFTGLQQLCTDSIICTLCRIHNKEHNIMTDDAFCTKFASDLFSKSFVNLMFDSSKVRCSYDYDSSYFYAYPYLTTVSDIAKPKVAQIIVSFPLRSGETEGNTAILGFIETESTYKFFGFSTIP